MALKDRKIIPYTKEDMEELYNSLTYMEANIFKSYEEVKKFRMPRYLLFAQVTIGNNKELIETESLSLLLWHRMIYQRFNRCEELKNFIHYTLLKEVPLYIRSFPDFVKWRLRIGK